MTYTCVALCCFIGRSKALYSQSPSSMHTHTLSHSDGGSTAKLKPTHNNHQQCGVQRLSQGHFHIWMGGVGTKPAVFQSDVDCSPWPPTMFTGESRSQLSPSDRCINAEMDIMQTVALLNMVIMVGDLSCYGLVYYISN